ncbi:MAG: 6,7-dimethyl-8-ribityllumazine synthase [Candidatus Methylarchaceae archaeon HK02M2]|nr:6,7-dimethyl-8-ribityllumazine synthase [Candidatus Methylarchaceae archaeon HK02M2]
MENIQIALVVSEFNFDISYLMLERAKEHAIFLGAQITYICKAPGSFDMPILIESLLEKQDVNAVVTLGAIVEGETKHDEIIAQHVTRKVTDLSVKYRKPVSLGVSGPGMSRIQGLERIDEYAKRAVEAAVKMVKRIRILKEIKVTQYPTMVE